mgnify:FL=1
MKTIICDIDGTLWNERLQPIQHVIDFINANYGKYNIALVTGRLSGIQSQTVDRLKKDGIKYNRIYMNPGSVSAMYDHKEKIAKMLNKDGDVVLAIDNDMRARDIYKAAGIHTCSPSNVNSQLLKMSWDNVF